MKQKMKLPCNVILLMALLPVSQRYKHLSWGFQHIPRGLLNFAWSPAPSAKPLVAPAIVVISSDVYMSAWLLKYSNHLYILSGIFSIYFWSLTCNQIFALYRLSLVLCCHCLCLGGEHWGISCQRSLKLRILLVIQQHNWDDETMLVICDHFWGCKLRWYTFAKCLDELEEWAGEIQLHPSHWGLRPWQIGGSLHSKDEFRVWRMRRRL